MAITPDYLSSKDGLELLNKIFLSAGEAIIIVDQSGEIRMANKRTEEIFEYTAQELHGMLVEELIPKKFREKHVGYRTGYIQSPESRPMGIGRYLTGLKKSGDEFPVEVSLSYVPHLDNKLVVAFITDITIRKKQEDALEESKQKLEAYANSLESNVKERTRELEHLNMGLKSQIRERKLAESALKESLDDLKKAEQEILHALENEKEVNEMKSRFISMASHEFRTPLTTILSSANLISKYDQTEQQPNRTKHIQRIKTAVQNLTNILNDFLSLDKLESGAIRLKVGPINIQELLEEIRQEFDATLKTNQVLMIDVPKDIPDLNSDMHIIKNTIINLTSNAIKYSNEGSTIHIQVKEVPDFIQIAVRDEGIGIPLEEQKNLFQRFYRADNVTNIQGTGLGLNIVKRYLDLIDGSITFTSEENKGSVFVVTFPIS